MLALHPPSRDALARCQSKHLGHPSPGDGRRPLLGPIDASPASAGPTAGRVEGESRVIALLSHGLKYRASWSDMVIWTKIDCMKEDMNGFAGLLGPIANVTTAQVGGGPLKANSGNFSNSNSNSDSTRCHPDSYVRPATRP